MIVRNDVPNRTKLGYLPIASYHNDEYEANQLYQAVT